MVMLIVTQYVDKMLIILLIILYVDIRYVHYILIPGPSSPPCSCTDELYLFRTGTGTGSVVAGTGSVVL